MRPIKYHMGCGIGEGSTTDADGKESMTHPPSSHPVHTQGKRRRDLGDQVPKQSGWEAGAGVDRLTSTTGSPQSSLCCQGP